MGFSLNLPEGPSHPSDAERCRLVRRALGQLPDPGDRDFDRMLSFVSVPLVIIGTMTVHLGFCFSKDAA